MLEHFREIQARLLAATPSRFKRYLGSVVDWQTRLFAVIGPRGVGKTTLLLQHLKEMGYSPRHSLYVSADNIQVQAVGLYELGGEFCRDGGEFLVIDEVHRYANWAAEVKSLYDSYPELRIGLSGSSTLDILKGRSDLSRRVVPYRLATLSFREYLCLETGHPLDPVELPQLLEHHVDVAHNVIVGLGSPILPLFRQYLESGCYPFFLEGRDLFPIRLSNVIEKVVSEDIPAVFGVRPNSVPTLKKLIQLVATSQPFAPNVERMAANLQVSKEYVYNYLSHLEAAGIFASLSSGEGGFKGIRGRQKIYLDNPNLYWALLGSADFAAAKGPVRESFFLNQLGRSHGVFADREVDFRTADGKRFEVGGRSKTASQFKGDAEGFVVVDDIEVGSGRRIPLWLFGMLY